MWAVFHDLANTYFEGSCERNPKARYGRSKEKRTDCPLVTLGLVLDGNGFPLASEVFAGNVRSPGTLETILKKLEKSDPQSHRRDIVVMDAGDCFE
ncbi:MAG: hypothetical protein ACRESZ_15535 [Methylococcales bacterium]